MQMQDYATLAAVAAVVREGSFERAAAVLGVTPSAVSQRVRSLEDRLGAVLVKRGQPCTATTIGARLCAHVERVRLLESELAAALPGLTRSEIGNGAATLRVAVNADSLCAWFMPPVAAFCTATGALVDLALAGEDHTAERLRTGEVLAAVTTMAVPVQGCRTTPLGALRYVATASPDFARRWFAHGVNAQTLAVAPVLRFDRNDHLQARWATAALDVALAAPTHWVPSSHGFIDATLAGLGWAMNPLSMVADHFETGRLVELVPGTFLNVPLHWQCMRIGTQLLDGLTKAVIAAARRSLVA
jgi:LysR family transcriptional regulator (chromosome initiation inhibitor)